MRKKIIVIFALIPVVCMAQEFDFTQERSTIPVLFDGIQCQVSWTTGYCYINPTFCDIDNDNDFDLFFGSDWGRISLYINDGNNIIPTFHFTTDMLVNAPNYVPLSQQSNRYFLCDIDNDGDKDLFLGYFLDEPFWTGKLSFFENIGNNQVFEFELVEENFQGIL